MYAIYRIILISADRKCVFSSLSLSLCLFHFFRHAVLDIPYVRYIQMVRSARSPGHTQVAY